MSDPTAVVLGCGYVGLSLTRALRLRNVQVVATTRSTERTATLEEAGAEAVVADVMDPPSLKPLAALSPDVVFDLVRPQRLDTNRYTSWGTQNVASTFAGIPIEALVYVSSTSVYGRRSGEVTTEDTETAPSSPAGRARVEAERVYLDQHEQRQLPARICRVPGIYGPGRTLRQRLESGAYRRLDEESLWISRIHVEDLAQALIAAWLRGRNGRIYLICDDEPTTDHAYAELTADLLSLPLPPTVNREDIRHELGEDAFERRISSRRCTNIRMREELGVELQYPTIRNGLPAALRAEGAI